MLTTNGTAGSFRDDRIETLDRRTHLCLSHFFTALYSSFRTVSRWKQKGDKDRERQRQRKRGREC